MARSKGFTGKGTVLSIGSGGSGETFTAIAQLKTLQPSGAQVGYDDVSNLDGPTMGTSGVPYEEGLPNKVAVLNYAIQGVWLPGDAGQQALMTAYQNQTLTDFKLQYPKGPGQATSGNLYTFSAYVTEPPLPDTQWDKVLGFKTTLRVEGGFTPTTGS